MPMPVTTTRFIGSNPKEPCPYARTLSDTGGRGCARLEQADAQVLGGVDSLAIGFQPAVADAKGEFAPDDALQIRRHIRASSSWAAPCPENLTSPTLKRAAIAGLAEPAEKEAEQLPQRVEPEAAGHDRIALEVAGEEPEVGLHVELGDDLRPCRARRPPP